MKIGADLFTDKDANPSQPPADPEYPYLSLGIAKEEIRNGWTDRTFVVSLRSISAAPPSARQDKGGFNGLLSTLQISF